MRLNKQLKTALAKLQPIRAHTARGHVAHPVNNNHLGTFKDEATCNAYVYNASMRGGASTPSPGATYFDSTEGRLKIWDGTHWVVPLTTHGQAGMPKIIGVREHLDWVWSDQYFVDFRTRGHGLDRHSRYWAHQMRFMDGSRHNNQIVRGHDDAAELFEMSIFVQTTDVGIIEDILLDGHIEVFIGDKQCCNIPIDLMTMYARNKLSKEEVQSFVEEGGVDEWASVAYLLAKSVDGIEVDLYKGVLMGTYPLAIPLIVAPRVSSSLILDTSSRVRDRMREIERKKEKDFFLKLRLTVQGERTRVVQ